MIAEIYGKIRQNNSNLSEISEDELTGNFFGQLRYIPFNEGLKTILENAIFPPTVGDLIGNVNVGFWNDKIEFWPYHSEGELDVYIEFDNLTIGVEVKYMSGLSSDDDVDYSIVDEKENIEKSRNQLQRESRIIAHRAKDKTKILLLVGDALSCVDIYTNINQRKLLSGSELCFGYATWQSILGELRKLKPDNKYSSLIISDLVSLLERKGFDKFNSMELEMKHTVSNDQYYWFDYTSNNFFTFESTSEIKVMGEYYYDFK